MGDAIRWLFLAAVAALPGCKDSGKAPQDGGGPAREAGGEGPMAPGAG